MSELLNKLKDQGLLDASGVERAAALVSQGQPVDEAVAAGAGVPEAQLIGLLAVEFNLPVADLSKEIPDKAFLNKFPVRLLLRHNVLPLSEKDGVVRIATGRALSNPGLAKLRLATGKRFAPVLAAREEIDRRLKELLGVGADTMQSLVSDSDEEGGIQVLSDEDAEGDLERLAEDASIVRFVNQVLTEAIDLRATDVHFEPFESRFRVRYRVDGELVEASTPAEVRRFQAAIVSRIKILSHLDIAEKRQPQDGRIKLKIAAREVDVRVSIIPMLHGEAVVLRLLDRSSPLLGMERLGMAAHDRAQMERVLELPHGIVLVTGPTGSGKTTTLYAGLSKINDISRKIVTIEDPIEYQLDGISQIQVLVKSGLTFAAGLRAILRHDPDVVLIGEIRDYETAEIAVQASLTGHLVFSTLHTNDAPGAVTRLVEMGVEPYLVASSLELVLAQRLVRLLCKECKQLVTPTDLECRELKAEFGARAPEKVWKSVGCRACNGAGFRGRQGVFEVMPISDEIRGMVLNNVAANELRKVAVKDGMKSLREDGKRLMLEGKTTLEEVMRMTKEELSAGGKG
jgi:general secretion pathway protein E